MVADYLAAVAEYDPDTPAAPEGEDFVAWFLTESHRGYCMHFASAAVLLLRSMASPPAMSPALWPTCPPPAA